MIKLKDNTLEVWLSKGDIERLKDYLEKTGESYQLVNFPVIINDLDDHLASVPNFRIEDPKDWIEEWRKLFPAGLNTIGRSYRGDKQACLKKMRRFIKEYKYSKEIIMKATKKALVISELENYAYFPQAHWFIDKNRQSLLSQYCEQLDDIEDTKSTVTAL